MFRLNQSPIKAPDNEELRLFFFIALTLSDQEIDTRRVALRCAVREHEWIVSPRDAFVARRLLEADGPGGCLMSPARDMRRSQMC